MLEDYPWIRLKPVSIPQFLLLVPDLGMGEAATLALGMENPSGSLLLIDDKLGRKIAKLQEMRVTGLAGVLLKSKEKGYVSSVKECLKELKDGGFYLKQSVMDDILEIAGE